MAAISNETYQQLRQIWKSGTERLTHLKIRKKLEMGL
jgi:hypothetical protein